MKFYLYRNSQTYGPYSEESLLEYLHSGKVSENDWACRKGEEEWVRLSDLIFQMNQPNELVSHSEWTEWWVVDDKGLRLEYADGWSAELEYGLNEKTETGDLTEEQVKEYTEKIEDLVFSNEENFAIDLVRSINSPRLYEELLKGCSINEAGTPILQNWWQDIEDKDLRPFFLELVAYCPEEASIDSSLQRELITKLNLSFCQSLSNVDGLSNLTNLTYLSLNVCSSLSNVDGLNNLTNLTELYINYSTSLTNVDGLSKLTNLRELDLHNCGSLSNVDGLSNLTNLTELYLEGCESLAEDQIDDLKAALPSCNINY